MEIDWKALWEAAWPILKEGLIAFLIALLTLLGYDRYVPSRMMRAAKRGEEEGDRELPF